VNHSILVVVLASAVAYGTPLLYAALGELLSERAGVLNLGVEGMMLVGAVMGFWAVQHVGGGQPLEGAAQGKALVEPVAFDAAVGLQHGHTQAPAGQSLEREPGVLLRGLRAAG